MATANIYLNFPGTTEEAFTFYKQVLGGEFITMMRFKDTPEAGNIAPQYLDKIMHASLPIGKDNILMATDAIEGMGHPLQAGNNFHISLGTASKHEADKIYNGLSAGGKAVMPMANTFWGSYFGMLVDKFGIQWMVSFDEGHKG